MRFGRRGRAERPPRSFADTIDLAKHGDRDAVTALYSDHVPLVYGYLRASRVPEPEDLTSEVFVGMLRGLGRFDGDEPAFRRWLMTIAHHRLVDERRRQSRNRAEAAEPSRLEAVTPTGETIELRPSGLDRDVADAFDALTEGQREVVALRFMADVSLEEVSTIIGKPVAAVKSLQYRGLASMRRQMGDPGPTGGGGDEMTEAR